MSFYIALIPLTLLSVLLGTNLFIFKELSSDGPNQIVLLFTTFITGFLGILLKKTTYKNIEEKIFETLSSSLYVLIFVILIGFLMSSWMAGGVVPSLIYYGLKILHPKLFLPLTTLICSLVSFTIGSSWSTGATLGVAFMGMGKILGFPPALVAGAIISGCYFGNTFSPLSETSVLSCTLNKNSLTEHTKFTAKLGFITILLALVIYLIIGLFLHTNASISIDETLKSIETFYTISWLPLFIPVIVLGLIIFKVPSLVAISSGVFLGILSWLFLQKGEKSYTFLVHFLLKGHSVDIQEPFLQKLFSGGGVYDLFSILLLIITAIIFGATMESSGFLQDISNKILSYIHGKLSLITSTLISGILFNGLLSDDYLSIIVTSKIYNPLYQEFKIDLKELTRAIQASSTVTAGLVPWCTGGAFFMGILDVPVSSYAPYSFYNILCPLVCFILTYYNMKKNTSY
jgi:NhaC family Na+:H+ antiporter